MEQTAGRRRRGQQKGRGRAWPRRQTLSNEIQATLADHVINHGLSLREAGQCVKPNLSHSFTICKMCTTQGAARWCGGQHRRITARGFQVRSPPGAFLCGVCMFSLLYAWVLSGYSGFLPLSKNMHVRLNGDSKLSLGVSVSVCLSLCGPVMDWRPVQGVPRLSPDDRWDRLQTPRYPTDGLDGIENGWMYYSKHLCNYLCTPLSCCAQTIQYCSTFQFSRPFV